MVRFDLGHLLQGETRIATLKSAYESLIFCVSGLGCETNLLEIMCWESPDVIMFFL